MKLIFDLESDNLLDNVSQIYCICAYDLDSDTAYSFRPDEIGEACQLLEQADVLIGHNIINYDLAVIEKLYSLNLYNKKLIDTILLSKLFNADIDGGHSLAAWGERLGFPKGDHNDWSVFSEEMLAYCEQDVQVTLRLYTELSKRVDVNAAYVRMEHKVAVIQHYQEVRGVLFDKQLCLDIIEDMNNNMADIYSSLADLLGSVPKQFGATILKPFLKNGRYAKAVIEWYGEDAYLVSAPFSRVEYVKVTLDTKKLLIDKLLSVGWQPTMFTEKGNPRLAEKGDVCENLLQMEGDWSNIGKYFVTKHRRGLAEGLLEQCYEVDGEFFITAGADTLGTVTGRYAHRGVVNIPSPREDEDGNVLYGIDGGYGLELRSLFKARKGFVQLGVDLSGIEARLLAHYMNDAEFTDTILNGDIHTFNQIKAGLPSRKAAKTFFYAFAYGAGDAKIGSIIKGGSKEGKALKEEYFRNLPSLKNLIDRLKKEGSKGYITAFDGRRMRLRRDDRGNYAVYKVLNTLLQSAGAIYFKAWMLFVNDYIKRYNLDCYQLISMHDELQFECKEEDVESLKQILEGCIKKADKYFDVKCPNACEVKVGLNWRDTH